MTPEQAYEWLAPKLSTSERKALDVIFGAVDPEIRSAPKGSMAPIGYLSWTSLECLINEGSAMLWRLPVDASCIPVFRGCTPQNASLKGEG